MKYSRIILLFLTISMVSCLPTRYITEKYIKTEIENHKPNEFSSIRLYSILKVNVNNGVDYIELTGYKSEVNKGLVIGAAKNVYFKNPQNDIKSEKQIVYINLTTDECKAIVENQKKLVERIKTEKVQFNEVVYHDFSVNKDLFISLRKGQGSSTIFLMDFWIKGEKYTVRTYLFMKKLSEFVNY